MLIDRTIKRQNGKGDDHRTDIARSGATIKEKELHRLLHVRDDMPLTGTTTIILIV